MYLRPRSSSAGALELDFTAMDRFMSDVLGTIKEEGSLIARVFPPQQDVLLAFAERVANEVVSAQCGVCNLTGRFKSADRPFVRCP